MKTIAIANQKGGVGKTTTTLNLAAGMQRMEKTVLCIDFDPQCHLGKYIGHVYDDRPTITDCLFAKATYCENLPTEGIIRRSGYENLDYIPASLKLSKADMVLAQAMFRETVLADVLSQLPLERYDYVLIDCNPSMGILLTNALIASDGVLIPVQAEDFAVDGMSDMLELIQLIKKQANPRLELLGLLPTMVTRTTTSDHILSYLRETYPELVFQNGITRSIDASKSVKAQRALIGTKSRLGGQYQRFTEEFLNRMEGEHESGKK